MSLKDKVFLCPDSYARQKKSQVFENQSSKWPLHSQILQSKMYLIVSNNNYNKIENTNIHENIRG